MIITKEMPVEQKNIIGMKALSGSSVTKLSQEFEVNRVFVYTQKSRIKEILESEEPSSNIPVVELDKRMVEKIIIAGMLLCKGSTEDIQRFLAEVFGISISIGKISSVINEAALTAKHWNESIDLSTIKIGANDEIFQGHSPILVGVDPLTTYTYLLNSAKHRDATTWGTYLLEKEKHQKLHLELSVNDGGLGLQKGVKEAFPDANIQLDVFHTEYDFSKAVCSAERSAYKDIKAEEKLRIKAEKRGTDKNIQNYELSVTKANASIDVYDKLYLLSHWIREILMIGGYTYDEKMELFNYIIFELERFSINNDYLKKSTKFIKGNLGDILRFVKNAEVSLNRLALDEVIPVEILYKMWKQLGFSHASADYNHLEAEIGLSLGCRYEAIHQKFKAILNKTVRASSIVECINSLIRPYLFLKKVVPDKFLDLLQFYFNTRKYRRSRKSERVGKSPIELLTGMQYPSVLALLGY